MRRERQSKTVRFIRSLQKSRDAAASSSIGLDYVDSPRFEHASEIELCISVLAGSDIHIRRRSAPDEAKSWKIV